MSVGCLPIKDDFIKELYVFAVEAIHSGQIKIPITIFPCRMTQQNYEQIIADPLNQDCQGLWEDLKTEYDYFESSKQSMKCQFLSNGRHRLTGA